MHEKDKEAFSRTSDDEFFDALCWLLDARGKSAIANKLRAAYYGLGADSGHSEESTKVTGTEPDPGTTSDSSRSKLILSRYGIDYVRPESEVSRPKDEYFRGVHSDSNS